MPSDDLAREADELLGIAGSSEARSLNQLAELVSRQVPGCSGAIATLWRGGEPVAAAASHPDLAALFEVHCTDAPNPWLDALASGQLVSCADTLDEERWPGYAATALGCGVRCSVTMAQRSGPDAITLTLAGARPRSIDPEQFPLAELMVAFGGVVLGNASAYGDAQRTALQLRDAAAARAIVDQAKGILMHALGCTAEHALERMRGISQTRNLKVTEVAQRIIDSHGALFETG